MQLWCRGSELLQVLTLHSGDEESFPGLGADLWWRCGGISVLDRGCGKRAVEAAAAPGEVVLREEDVIVSGCYPWP